MGYQGQPMGQFAIFAPFCTIPLTRFWNSRTWNRSWNSKNWHKFQPMVQWPDIIKYHWNHFAKNLTYLLLNTNISGLQEAWHFSQHYRWSKPKHFHRCLSESFWTVFVFCTRLWSSRAWSNSWNSKSCNFCFCLCRFPPVSDAEASSFKAWLVSAVFQNTIQFCTAMAGDVLTSRPEIPLWIGFIHYWAIPAPSCTN